MTDLTYADWIALCEREPEKANALCAEAMGWCMSRGKSYWLDAPDGHVVHNLDCWSPITDRNHAAMMVEEAVNRGLEKHVVKAAAFVWTSDGCKHDHLLALTLAPAAMSAYCALVALKEAPCQRT